MVSWCKLVCAVCPQGTIGSLPSHVTLLDQSTKMKEDTKDLRTSAAAAAADLSSELDAVRRLDQGAQQVSRPPMRAEVSHGVGRGLIGTFSLQAAVGAAAALQNAKQTRAAVGQTLRDLNGLLANMSESRI